MAKKKRTGLSWAIIIIAKAFYDLIKKTIQLLIYIGKSIWQSIGFLRGKRPIPKITLSKKAPREIRKIEAVETEIKLVSGVSGRFDDFLNRLSGESLIIPIIGRRGSGKSALGFTLMENLHAKEGRKAYVMGVKQQVLPDWIKSVDEISQVENGGLVLIDEGAVTFSSRDSMSSKNKELGKLLAIARHKDMTLLLITQNTGMMDKNVMNLTDTLLLKEGSLLQEKMERPVMKQFYQKVKKAFDEIPKAERKSHVYVFDDEFEGMISTQLPSFWSSKVSKSQE